MIYEKTYHKCYLPLTFPLIPGNKLAPKKDTYKWSYKCLILSGPSLTRTWARLIYFTLLVKYYISSSGLVEILARKLAPEVYPLKFLILTIAIFGNADTKIL